MRQGIYTNIEKFCLLIFTFLILIVGCSSPKVVITERQHEKYDNTLLVYADLKESVANNEFLSASEESLIKGYELLLNQNAFKAKKVLTELWRTDSIFNEKALSILYEYYFYHTKWNSFMNLAEMTDSFPDGYEIVKDFYGFPREEINFPLEDSVLVPIKKFNYGNTPVVAVQINGIEKYFIVDTGVSISAVSYEVAQECGITKGSSAIDMRDAHNTLKKNAALPAYIKEFKINELTISNHPVIISDNLKLKIFGITVYKIDGVIGWNLLQQLKVQIDYPNKTIELTKSIKKNQKRGILNGLRLPFITTTTTNGSKLFLHFDTGANCFTLSSNAIDKIEQSPGSERTTISFGAISNRKEREKIIENFSFFIGNYEFNYSEIGVSNLEVSPGNLIQLNGRIGNRPFLNGVISFDYKNGIFEYTKSK